MTLTVKTWTTNMCVLDLVVFVSFLSSFSLLLCCQNIEVLKGLRMGELEGQHL